VILATRYAGDVAMRSGVIGDASIPMRTATSRAWTGSRVDIDTASGLAAWGAAIRLITTTIATFELDLYKGSGAGKVPVESGWQHALFEQPWSEGSQFDWLCDLAAGPEGFGNAFLQKMKNRRGEVVELIPIDPECVSVRRENGVKVFDIFLGRQGRRTLTASEILHVRGQSVRGFLSGFSPVQMYKQAIGGALGLAEFQGRYMANDASPGVVIEVPGKPDREQAKLMLETWNADHQGLPNAGKPGILWNGSKLSQIPVSLVDAQFVESQKFSVDEIARVTGVPASLLEAGMFRTASTVEQDWLRFMRLCVYPKSLRILSALKADADVFPPGLGVYPAFEYDAVLAVDAATQATVDKENVQSGILLVDEVRARKGIGPLPPVPDDWTQAPGKVPQLTPVGGAPAPLVGTGKAAPAEVANPEASISTED